MDRKMRVKQLSKLDKFVVRSGGKFSKTSVLQPFWSRMGRYLWLKKVIFQTSPSKLFSLSISINHFTEIEPKPIAFIYIFTFANTRKLSKWHFFSLHKKEVVN